MPKRVLSLNVNPGESLDGSGRVCIHLFVRDEMGPFVEPHVLGVGGDGGRQIVAGPARGRLACDPKRLVAPVTRGNTTTVTPRTDDPRAATCPRCLASKDCAEMMATITRLENER